METYTEIEELKKICLEQRRQITLLFELYERQKNTNDSRYFHMNQTLEQLNSQIEHVSKRSKDCVKSFDHLNLAIKSFGWSDMLKSLTSLERQVKELAKHQADSGKFIAEQSATIGHLENTLRRTYVLSEDTSQQVFQNLEFPMTNFMLCNSPTVAPQYGGNVSPLSISESSV